MDHRAEGRRHFLKVAGLAGLGLAAAGLAGCTSTTSTGGHTTVSAPAPGQLIDFKKMDEEHAAGIKTFLKDPKVEGLTTLRPEVENGVKVFRITCKAVQWEVEPGRKVDAYTYNGVVPGPVVRVKEGDRVRFVVNNELPESTSIHWHGLMVPNDQDGVPYITQDPILPGATFTYEFTIRDGNAGTHMYHSHHNATKQVSMGLLGALIVEPKDASREPKADKDYIIVLSDGPHGYTINGRSFPGTALFTAKKGERVRFRFMNEGSMIHPMHLHGYAMEVYSVDGYPLPQPYKTDTVLVAPGNRYDAFVTATEAGAWALHCHVLPHAESEHGMFGMVTALVVS